MSVIIVDKSTLHSCPVVSFLARLGYSEDRDYRRKLSLDYHSERMVGTVIISAYRHCPEVETLLALKFGESVI